MALTATLEFGDNNIKRYSQQYLVSDYHLVFVRSYNAYAPEETARCERLELVVVAPGRDDLSLFEWFTTQGAQDGRIVIGSGYDKNMIAEDVQVIYFEEARCFSFEEEYHINRNQRRMLRLRFVAENVYINDVIFKRI